MYLYVTHDTYNEYWKLHISDRQHAHYTLPITNPLNAELNPICHLLALLGAHHIFHVSGLRVNALWTCHFCQILSFLCDMHFHYLKYFIMFPYSTSIRTLSHSRYKRILLWRQASSLYDCSQNNVTNNLKVFILTHCIRVPKLNKWLKNKILICSQYLLSNSLTCLCK